MRLISANVNGVRAAARRGGVRWLADQAPDVVVLQETRASADQLAGALSGSALEHWSVALEAGASGRAGVAVLTPTPPVEVRGAEVLGAGDVAAGRWVEADVATPTGTVTVASLYVHTGEAGTERQVEKYALLDAVERRLKELAEGGPAVVSGDLNVCHTARDLRNWKGNVGKAGFLPQEQDYLTRWLDSGWVDVVRARAGDVDGPYTWWSWRGQAFDRDTGWRIDYQLATADLGAAVRDAWVGRAPSYPERWSDHAAVVVDYDRPAGASAGQG